MAESSRKVSEPGTLVQLVWKFTGFASANPVAEESKVAINWNQPQAGELVCKKYGKNTPSRKRRNFQCFWAFMEKKRRGDRQEKGQEQAQGRSADTSSIADLPGLCKASHVAVLSPVSVPVLCEQGPGLVNSTKLIPGLESSLNDILENAIDVDLKCEMSCLGYPAISMV